jgi:hypothetical protein
MKGCIFTRWKEGIYTQITKEKSLLYPKTKLSLLRRKDFSETSLGAETWYPTSIVCSTLIT